ncbi:MAG TPA: DUF1499 domain-containing protein [Stellaceae bacterium]|jgi:hypothetical protein|nr:DUF1499 domain-containing protein [Stellaceae bacterium]
MLIKFLIVVLLVAGLGLGVRLYMGRTAEDMLRPGERVAIRELHDPLPGNSFLACPPDYCAATGTPSPTFALPADRLEQDWRQMLASEPGIVIVADEPAQHRLVVIQHTKLLRFPDVVTAEFVALDNDRSSVAVYSKSRYGSGDFGTNRKRILRWLDRLRQQADQ